MTDKRMYNSRINAKGLEASVSEDQARDMCLHQGGTYLFIVEAQAGPKVVNVDGSQAVSLIPGSVELVPDEHSDRVRRFMRALYLTRPDQYGQEAFDGATANEPTVVDSASQLDAVVETDPEGNPTGLWVAGDEGGCAYPGCVLEIGHDGEHQDPEDVEAQEDSNVVQFTN